jgi:hypothetical protein
VSEIGPELDAARQEVAARELVPDAVTQLNEIVAALPLESLAPVKQHLKRFFSDSPWTDADDEALADLVGNGVGGGEHELAPGLTLVWRWPGGRFRLRVERTEADGDPWASEAGDAPEATDLEATFDGPVVPEATPSPRTIRFATAAIHGGPSRSYDSADDAEADPRVARLFREFEGVTSVLVGPDFVAVSLDRPGGWESLLAPVLTAVTDEFAREATEDREPTPDEPGAAPVTLSLSVGTTHDDEARPRHLDRAWAELGGLDARRPLDLDRLVAAGEDREPARRQVAATLLAEGPRDIATRAWSRLLNDRSRVVRRSVVDAMVDTGWPEVRALLEVALDDTDAWVRWKALKGIARLGAAASRDAVEARRDDPDFRVRLEAAAALRRSQ